MIRLKRYVFFVLLTTVVYQYSGAQDPIEFSNMSIDVDTFRVNHRLDRDGEIKVTGHASFYFDNVSETPMVLQSLKWSNSRNYMNCEDRYDPILPGDRIFCTALTNHGSPPGLHSSHTTVSFHFSNWERKYITVRSELNELPLNVFVLSQTQDSTQAKIASYNLLVSLENTSSDTIMVYTANKTTLFPGQKLQLTLPTNHKDRWGDFYTKFIYSFGTQTFEYGLWPSK